MKLQSGNIVPSVTFNETALVNGVEAKKVIALDAFGNMVDSNATVVIYKNAAGEVVKIEKVIGSTTYTKTIDRTDNAPASALTINPWT